MIQFRPLIFLAAILFLSGCTGARVLAPTPNIYLADGYPSEEVTPALQSAEAPIFYVTDREGEPSQTGVQYGSVRSSAMVFGEAKVSFGEGQDWASLSDASGQANRTETLPLKIQSTRELTRFDATPIPFHVENGRPVLNPDALVSYKRKRAAFQQQVRDQIRVSGNSDVVVFVHGFNNSFDDAVFALTDIWHFSGRRAVPIAYSWPAGAGGLFGYFTDRESGEYTVFHLKDFLRHLAEIPDVQNIHIVAHSRGTDVTTTALRELIIAERAKGTQPRRTLKIANLILAAPDLDFSVVRQRLIAEGFGVAIGQITVYMNTGDTALGLAQRLMTGQRLGKLTVDDIRPAEREIFANVKSVNFVNVEGVKGLSGHAYFRTNRNVLSDIALLIREGAFPGTETRPLERIDGNFWNMSEKYPF